MRTISQKTHICRNAPSECEKLQDFVVPDWDPNEAGGGGGRTGGLWGGFIRFLKHLNPVKWIRALIENITDVFGWLGMIVDIVIVVVVIVVIVKIKQTCCPKACKCKHNKKSGKIKTSKDGRVWTLVKKYDDESKI